MAVDIILDSPIREILMADGVRRAHTHHCTKFHQNRFFLVEILQFIKFSKWPPMPSWIFEIIKIFLAIGVESVETHQRAKFRQNRSIGCEDIKIFRFFNMAAPPS